MAEKSCSAQWHGGTCDKPAVVAPRINVPWLGLPPEQQPFNFIMGVEVCQGHFDQMHVKNFLLPEGGARLAQIMMQGLADLDRAYLTAVPIDSPEYLDYLRATMGAKH